MDKLPKFSLFVPVNNEEGNIKKLYGEIKPVMDKMGSWELILINDGSDDGSLEEMEEIHKKSDNVIVVDLKKNYGQSIAMDAGFRQARGEYVISLDADLQNDPADIPAMFEQMQKENLDVIAGWRKKRKDPTWMLAITRVAKMLRKIFINDGVNDSGCTLRIYRSEYIKDMELWGEMHRYVVALLKWQGARVGQRAVNHRPRTAGITKYNWKKSIKGLIDLFYIWFWRKYSNRPLHLFGSLGLFLVIVGAVSAAETVWIFFQGQSLSDSAWPLLTAFFLIMGIQFFFFGVIIDLLIRNHYNTSKVEDRYAIKKIYK
ncbi:MAG: glycosyltransferase family 2 protein [Candidatus Moranbacteria bacterium]|nr:glycosyltransferase family 2 protein [Candidatus Moranbacteria bacterium]